MLAQLRQYVVQIHSARIAELRDTACAWRRPELTTDTGRATPALPIAPCTPFRLRSRELANVRRIRSTRSNTLLLAHRADDGPVQRSEPSIGALLTTRNASRLIGEGRGCARIGRCGLLRRRNYMRGWCGDARNGRGWRGRRSSRAAASTVRTECGIPHHARVRPGRWHRDPASSCSRSYTSKLSLCQVPSQRRVTAGIWRPAATRGERCQGSTHCSTQGNTRCRGASRFMM